MALKCQHISSSALVSGSDINSFSFLKESFIGLPVAMSKLSKTLKSPKYGKYDLIWISSEILISLNYKK